MAKAVKSKSRSVAKKPRKAAKKSTTKVASRKRKAKSVEHEVKSHVRKAKNGKRTKVSGSTRNKGVKKKTTVKVKLSDRNKKTHDKFGMPLRPMPGSSIPAHNPNHLGRLNEKRMAAGHTPISHADLRKHKRNKLAEKSLQAEKRKKTAQAEKRAKNLKKARNAKKSKVFVQKKMAKPLNGDAINKKPLAVRLKQYKQKKKAGIIKVPPRRPASRLHLRRSRPSAKKLVRKAA